MATGWRPHPSLASLMPHSVDELHRPLPIVNVLAAVAEAAGIVRDIDARRC